MDFGKAEKNEPEPGSIEDLRNKVIAYAEQEVEKLERISNKQRDKFNTATVVYDAISGDYYYGRNRGIDIDQDEKNGILFGDSEHEGILPEQSFHDFPLGNCAEIHAVNKALNGRAQLNNLIVYTIHANEKWFGEPKLACKNCTYTLKGKIKDNPTGWIEGD